MSSLQTVEQNIATIPDQFTITSPADMTKATELLSLANKQNDVIKIEKEKVLKPLREAANAEKLRWKPAEDKLKEIIDSLRKEMGRYQTEEKKRADAEKAKIAARMGEGKGKLKLTTVVKKQAEIATPEDKVASEAGMATFVTDYDIVIEDITKVPHEYLKIELRKADIKKAAKAGKTIPGLIINEVQSVRNNR